MDKLDQQLYNAIKSGLDAWRLTVIDTAGEGAYECPYTGIPLTRDNSAVEFYHGKGFTECAAHFRKFNDLSEDAILTARGRYQWINFFWRVMKARLISIGGDITPEDEKHMPVEIECYENGGMIWRMK